MNRRRFFGTVALAAVTCFWRSQQKDILQESGCLLSKINQIKRLAIPKYSYRYQAPNKIELEKFRHLVDTLASERIDEALDLASHLDYELVDFTETSTGQKLYELRESLIPGKLRGWGTYFINPNYKSKALVEVPHILFDRFSENIAGLAFLKAKAKGLLIAGAHRSANGKNTTDVCHVAGSIFQEVHQSWLLPTWQIHGFDVRTKAFGLDTQVVLSDGRGQVSAELIELARRLKPYVHTQVYNKLAAASQVNQEFNQSEAGFVFSHLAATRNLQGLYCHNNKVAFTHVELDKSIRFNRSLRELVAGLIADSIRAVS